MERVYRSCAKINLHLQVVGRRADGYHELRTVFQTIDLHDRMGIELGGDAVELEVRRGDVPSGEGNLAVRAAMRYLERWAPGRGVRLWLEKRIPIGGGLGGGSSNAATVLLALQELLGSPAAPQELWSLARELGADVPYFLIGGTALGVGRGDEVLPIRELESTELWIVTPPIQVSTAEIFHSVQELTGEAMASSILALARSRVEGSVRLENVVGFNDLAPIVLTRFAAIGEVYNLLLEAGAAPVGVSGTGASLFARFDNEVLGVRAMATLPVDVHRVQSQTLSRAEFVAFRTAGSAV